MFKSQSLKNTGCAPFGHAGMQHDKRGKCLSGSSWYVESMAEYLSHDEQTVAGGLAEAVVLIHVKGNWYQGVLGNGK